MIQDFLKKLCAPKWQKPSDVKNFAWSADKTSAFGKWSRNKKAGIDDLPLAWLFQGTMLGTDLWENVDHWWKRFPGHFGMFWSVVQSQPRQKWSRAALHTLSLHVPIDEVENLVQSALLCDDGRSWLLASKDYAVYLRHINEEQMRQWVRSTTYSMPSLFEAFESLIKLQGYTKNEHNEHLLATTLFWHYGQQQALDASSNIAKAWNMSTPDLDNWMNEDKQLPFWFDPVNRSSWLAQCRHWVEQTGYDDNDKSGILSIIR